MKYLSLITVGATALLSLSCNANGQTSDGFTKLNGGLEYKNVVKGSGTTVAKPGDFAEVNVTMKIDDSVMFSTMKINHGQPVKQMLMAPHAKGDLMEGLLLMKPGDSTIFRMKLDTLAALSHQPRPEWVKDKNAYAVWGIKLVSLMTKEQNDSAMAKAEEKQKGIDDSLILNYFKQHKIANYQKTSSGLYYVVNKQGAGVSPKEGQKVTVNYTGALLDGEVFDSNTDPKFKHVKPFEFPLGQHRVIPGWDEGIALMKKGEKATFYIPSHLGYGQRGAGGRIPPNSVLVFDIELVSFQ